MAGRPPARRCTGPTAEVLADTIVEMAMARDHIDLRLGAYCTDLKK